MQISNSSGTVADIDKSLQTLGMVPSTGPVPEQLAHC